MVAEQVAEGVLAEPKFEEHCRRSVHGLRGALLDLYRAVGADPARPQDVSRRFRLNKNLTWKVARILAAEDAFSAVPLIPGTGGLDILLEAMAGAGAPAAAVDRVRGAAVEFDRMIEVHTGDRGTLELVLDSMGAGRPLEMSRKLAFRGASGVWGIQAGVRVTTHVLAPNRDDPSRLDAALMGGLTRVRRLRPVERWPVFQVRLYEDDGTTRTSTTRREAIEPGTGDRPGDPWLMRSFCTGAMPEVHVSSHPGATLYELGEGPVGKTGEFSCLFGFIDRGEVPRFRDEANRVGELVSSVSIPSEHLQLDLIAHESLGEVLGAEAMLYGSIGGSLDNVGSMRLPMAERVTDLGVGAPVGTPLIERYDEAVGAVMARAGWDAREFRCLRLVMECPPMSSRALLRYALPERA